MEDATPEYQRGFNVGYQLAKYEPELIGQLITGDKNSDYILGLNMGKKQLDRERLLEQLKESQQARNNDRSR